MAQLLADSGNDAEAASRLAERIAAGRLLVLTGAGVSTDSGIPDYRDEQGAWKRAAPMQFRDFVGSDAARRRYWARSLLGFRSLGRALPNRAHHALAALEARGLVRLLVTQNVDGLHQAAGSTAVVDLHGRLDRVVCLRCGHGLPRIELQSRLGELNPHWLDRAASTAPDGDAVPEVADYNDFRVMPCDRCGGILKPDVVFFGENVPKARVERSMDALAEARSLLVVGSSLMVFSGYRFPRAAQRLGIPLIIVNRGHTRADALSSLKVDGNAGAVLERAVSLLGSTRAR
jgi:NAD-dependent SIR2 family protein deacetylase